MLAYCGRRVIYKWEPLNAGSNIATGLPYTAGLCGNRYPHAHRWKVCLRVANSPRSTCSAVQDGQRIARSTRPAASPYWAASKVAARVASGATKCSHFPSSERTCASAVSKSSVSGTGGRDNTSATVFCAPSRYMYWISNSDSYSNQRNRRLEAQAVV